ncbi:DEHA2D08998p [Debaryomyces hansenii CBS767]|uniref:DEHA2D08998p n=1 Tax=Debaryomyces hansenii (strain ATCC 36239 / CBS 767 / BCRC 21394 / JCM 1990 / NBRC 0083 / IGC 2968) TaxID=284592 RepID=Q6BSG5_DEBHA|nr:DEHA2D08998p [Debaryomyces hansenii CBS767]CAG87007.2 DEHA2D08998p [Debaryomyces hansenii CBS767]|eukprot:XP_458855.2 DEHA2D08998p [Debaryomyces hansenii CBS767]
MNDLQYQSIGSNDNNKCSVFEGASKINFAFSVLITIGIIVSYLPQYRRIYIKKTSEGLSTNFLFLGSCSSIFTLTNIILVSSKARHCCYIGALNFFNCLNSQLNLIQIGIQCTCAILILVVVLLQTRYSIKQDKDEYARIVTVGKFVALHGIISIIEVFTGLYTNRTLLLTIAQINGLLSALLTMMKYVPQITTTYRLKHPGTLSIGMMCIQTPGGFIFTMTLFFTKGSHWSSWVSYLVAALLQGTLLLLCIYYEYIRNEGITSEILERREIDRNIIQNLDGINNDDSETDVLIRS